MLLKPNSTGHVNKSTVRTVKLSLENRKKIGRIVEELIELDEELNFEEFCKAVDLVEQENNEETEEVPDEFE